MHFSLANILFSFYYVISILRYWHDVNIAEIKYSVNFVLLDSIKLDYILPSAIAGHKSRCNNTQQSISLRVISKEKKNSTVQVCANVHLSQALCTGKLKEYRYA